MYKQHRKSPTSKKVSALTSKAQSDSVFERLKLSPGILNSVASAKYAVHSEGGGQRETEGQ